MGLLWLWTCAPLYIVQALADTDLGFQRHPGLEVDWMLGEAGRMIRAAEEIKPWRTPGLQDEPARPTVPRRFSADIEYVTFESGFLQTGRGFFAQDANEEAMRVLTVRHTLGMSQLLNNHTSLLLGNESYIINGGDLPICKKLPFFGQQQFVDLFAWAANPAVSRYTGERVVAGRACSLWYLLSTNQTRISLCAAGNTPVELNVTLSRSGTTFNFTYQFDRLKLGSEVPEQLLQKLEICDSFAPACENGRGLDPVPLDAYIFHPGMSVEDYNIEDQNVADLAGDAAFICMDWLFHESPRLDHNYTLISRYSLEISPAFGQYRPCNGYPDTIPPGPSCVPGDPRLVGREAPFSAGEGELRCAAGSPLGFWYQLPKGGRCSTGHRPSKEAWATGCTWSVQKRLKTIQQACLLRNHNFLQYCKADVLEDKGFGRSMKALEAAFASEDSSLGGCADVGEPVAQDSESMVVV